jgi:N-acetylglutamate synthase-like GNAT family acetyltransferase
VVRENGRIVAAGALQQFGSLVRSVVVAADRRGAGLGRLMARGLERIAHTARIGQLILLTQPAKEFFARQGISRHRTHRCAAGRPAERRVSFPVFSLCALHDETTVRL